MFRTVAYVLLFMLATASVVIAADNGTKIPESRVAVMNLTVTGEGSDQVREWLPAIIEEKLLEKGWSLVVRGERMQHIQEERNLPGVDPATKVEDNSLLGATAFLELQARVQITGIQGALGFGRITVGDYVRASVDLNGQITDVKTGLLKSSIKVGGSASGMKTLAVVSIRRDWDLQAGGFNLEGIKHSLVGKAADTAAKRLVDKLDTEYKRTPASRISTKSGSSASIQSEDIVESTIFIQLPSSSSAKPGDKYGIFRGDQLIAEVELISIQDSKAYAKILSQTSSIKATDKARKMPMTISSE